MKYKVEVYELHTQMYEVEADSPEQAVDNVNAGDGTCLDGALEYIEIANEYAGKGLPPGIRAVMEA